MARRKSGKMKQPKILGDFLVKASAMLFMIAAIIVVLYMISLMSSTTSLIILAVFIVSAAMAIWYNYMTAGTIRG